VTPAREAIGIVEVARNAVVLVANTFSREAAMARDSTNLHIKDAEYRATLAEDVALEQVSRAEAENSTALRGAHPSTDSGL
jgi:F0F1-type ATP synthase epsilon subunit